MATVRSARTLARLNSSASPVASTSTVGQLEPCAGCKSSFSTAALRAPVSHPSVTSATRQSHQRVSPWDLLSNALFRHAPALPPAEAEAAATPAPYLSSTAIALVAELKSSYPDSQRVWTLFSQLDYEGTTHTLPTKTLRGVLRGLTPRAARFQRHTLSLRIATVRAQELERRVERVRQRLHEVGTDLNEGDLSALASQYFQLGYAPGACRVWDEAIENGFTLSPRFCRHTFGALEMWVTMHARMGGRDVAKAAASPLVQKVVAMLVDITQDTSRMRSIVVEDSPAQQEERRLVEVARLELAIPTFFVIARHAQDRVAFETGMKAYYGFDMNLPGAEVDASAQAKAKRRPLGEEQIQWIFDFLAGEKTNKALSSMIAIFEVCDNPSPPELAEPTFFDASFASPFPPPRDTPPHANTLAPPPVVGPRALSRIITTAGSLGHGYLVRHYFDILFTRWSISADRKISEIECLVGIVPQDKSAPLDNPEAQANPPLLAQADVPDGVVVADGVVPSPSVNVAQVESLDEPISNKKARRKSSRKRRRARIMTKEAASRQSQQELIQSRNDQPLRRMYYLSSRLVADLARQTYRHTDATLATFLRRRVRHTLQLSTEHSTRLGAVLDLLETPPPPPPSDALPTSPQPLPLEPPSSRALRALSRETSSTLFHQIQLRLIHNRVKADSNVITQRRELDTLKTALRRRNDRLALAIGASGKGKGKEVLQGRVGVRRKQHQVVTQRMKVARMYLLRLQVLGRATPGARQYEYWMEKWKEAKAELSRKEGQEGATEGDDGWTPEEAGLGEAKV